MKIEQVLKTGSLLPLPKRTVLNVLYTQHFVSDKLAEVFKAHDLSVEQYNVLRILRGRKGEAANMCAIQERMIARTSNTTRLVDKLLAKGYVTRDVCPQNRRKMEVKITPAGLQSLDVIDPLVDAAESSLSNHLSADELDTLNSLLEKYRGIEP